MKVQITDYLKDILNGGDNHRNLCENIPIDQKDFKASQPNEGVLLFEPKLSSPLSYEEPLALSCGVHGNETAPIEIVDDLLKDIASGKLKLRRPLLIIFGHIKAMLEHKRFIDFNLNRLFSNNHQSHPSAMESDRARELEEVVQDFFKRYGKGLHLDLHTAIRPSHLKRFAVYPTHKDTTPPSKEINILKEMEIEGILLSNESAATFSAFSARECNCKAFTLELGKVEPFGKNNRSDFLAAQRTLEKLIEGTLSTERVDSEIKVFKVVHEMIRENKDYIFHIPEDYANFTPLEEGTPLETTSKGQLKANSNQAVVFPNSDVKLGQRTGLLIEEVKSL